MPCEVRPRLRVELRANIGICSIRK